MPKLKREELERQLESAWLTVEQVHGVTRVLCKMIVEGRLDAARAVAEGMLSDRDLTGQPLRRVDGQWVWDSWHARVLAASCAETLRSRRPDDPQRGPFNYFQFSLKAGDMDLALLLQRKDGDTPAEVAAKARMRVAELEQRIAAAMDVMRLAESRFSNLLEHEEWCHIGGEKRLPSGDWVETECGCWISEERKVYESIRKALAPRSGPPIKQSEGTGNE